MILTVTMNPAIDKIYFVDNYRLGEVHRPSETIVSPGGKGLNVARVAKMMGEEVCATGPLGGGNGLYIKEGIEALGIQPAFCQIEGETRICINVTDRKSHQCTEVLEGGPVLSKEEVVSQMVVFEELMEGAEVVTISGSLAKGVPSTFYSHMIERAKVHGIKVILDSSGDAFSAGFKAKPYAIKPNEDELKELYMGPLESLEDKMEAIRYFKSQGIEMPIISLGKDGSLAGLSDGIYKVSLGSVDVINTVGSGDSFVAGLAVGIRRGLDEKSLLKMASACGTANTQYAQTGYVEEALVIKYFDQAEVKKVADYV